LCPAPVKGTKSLGNNNNTIHNTHNNTKKNNCGLPERDQVFTSRSKSVFDRERKIQPILIFEANFVTEAKLVHIDVEISGSLHSPSELRLPIRALHDSGCAKTVIKTSKFLQLAKQTKIELKQNSVPTVLVTATGARQQITGLADIFVHFEGLNGTSVSYPLEVMVHPELNQDFLLGRDFTGSAAKAFETNERMFLTQNPEKLDSSAGSVSEMIRKRLLCDVPLLTKGSDPKFVATNHVTIIPPYSMVGATCTLQKSPTQSTSYRLKQQGQRPMKC
jgi:hypothetical protein